MPLKFKITNKEEIPAELASAYVEKDGVFLLDVEGVVEKSKLDEFRQNNINLQNQLKTFEGLDVEKARELLKKQQELEEGELIKKGDFNALIDSRLKDINKALDTERERNNALQAQIQAAKLTDTVQAAGTKAGVRPTAMPDLLARAKGAFKVVDGQVVAIEAGTNLDAWMEALKAEAPHLFESNSGGGAPGNGSGGAGLSHGKNPWSAKTWNLTEQSRITRENPRLAQTLKAAA